MSAPVKYATQLLQLNGDQGYCCAIQDVYVEPSELQKRLYEDFSNSAALRQVASVVSGDVSADAGADPAAKAPHVFQVNLVFI